jgi:hypothetical protein
MGNLEDAILTLRAALADEGADNWRWRMRQSLSALRDALDDEPFRSWDGWLTARSRGNERERIRLLRRISAVSAGVLDRLDPAPLRVEVQRLLADVEHYRQRVHDLLYDSVALEIGGSE